MYSYKKSTLNAAFTDEPEKARTMLEKLRKKVSDYSLIEEELNSLGNPQNEMGKKY